jgi:hypothetical protein
MFMFSEKPCNSGLNSTMMLRIACLTTWSRFYFPFSFNVDRTVRGNLKCLFIQINDLSWSEKSSESLFMALLHLFLSSVRRAGLLYCIALKIILID